MSEVLSDTVTVTAPTLVGVWVHDPTDADGSEVGYLFTDGREEAIEADEAELSLVGRTNPLLEYGDAETVGLSLTIVVPFDESHDAAVQWWRDAARNRRAIVYRDNRGRVLFGAIKGGLGITDTRAGTAVALTLRRIDYTAAA